MLPADAVRRVCFWECSRCLCHRSPAYFLCVTLAPPHMCSVQAQLTFRNRVAHTRADIAAAALCLLLGDACPNALAANVAFAAACVLRCGLCNGPAVACAASRDAHNPATSLVAQPTQWPCRLVQSGAVLDGDKVDAALRQFDVEGRRWLPGACAAAAALVHASCHDDADVARFLQRILGLVKCKSLPALWDAVQRAESSTLAAACCPFMVAAVMHWYHPIILAVKGDAGPGVVAMAGGAQAPDAVQVMQFVIRHDAGRAYTALVADGFPRRPLAVACHAAAAGAHRVLNAVLPHFDASAKPPAHLGLWGLPPDDGGSNSPLHWLAGGAATAEKLAKATRCDMLVYRGSEWHASVAAVMRLGFDVDHCNGAVDVTTALGRALATSHVGAARALLSHGAALVGPPDTPLGARPLDQIRLRRGTSELASFLIDEGHLDLDTARIHRRCSSSDGSHTYTLLAAACTDGGYDTVCALCERGAAATREANDARDVAALCCAARPAADPGSRYWPFERQFNVGVDAPSMEAWCDALTALAAAGASAKGVEAAVADIVAESNPRLPRTHGIVFEDGHLCFVPRSEDPVPAEVAFEAACARAVTLLVKMGASVEEGLRGAGAHPLYVVQSPAVAQALLTGGADPNAVGANGRRPLHRRWQWWNDASRAVLLMLLAAGGDPTARYGWCGDTPLHLNCNCPDVAAALVRAGADVNAVNALGATPLLDTACVAAATRLIDLGAKVDAPHGTCSGATRAMLAAGNGERAMLSALLAAGADPNARDVYGRTVLFYVRYERADALELVDMLLAAGGDAHAASTVDAPGCAAGSTPFAMACGAPRLRMTQPLTKGTARGAAERHSTVGPRRVDARRCAADPAACLLPAAGVAFFSRAVGCCCGASQRLWHMTSWHTRPAGPTGGPPPDPHRRVASFAFDATGARCIAAFERQRGSIVDVVAYDVAPGMPVTHSTTVMADTLGWVTWLLPADTEVAPPTSVSEAVHHRPQVPCVVARNYGDAQVLELQRGTEVNRSRCILRGVFFRPTGTTASTCAAGRYIAGMSRNHVASVWDMTTGAVVYETAEAEPAACILAPSGLSLVLAGATTQAHLTWQLQSADAERLPTMSSPAGLAAAWSDSERRVAVTTTSHVGVFDTALGFLASVALSAPATALAGVFACNSDDVVIVQNGFNFVWHRLVPPIDRATGLRPHHSQAATAAHWALCPTLTVGIDVPRGAQRIVLRPRVPWAAPLALQRVHLQQDGHMNETPARSNGFVDVVDPTFLCVTVRSHDASILVDPATGKIEASFGGEAYTGPTGGVVFRRALSRLTPDRVPLPVAGPFTEVLGRCEPPVAVLPRETWLDSVLAFVAPGDVPPAGP